MKMSELYYVPRNKLSDKAPNFKHYEIAKSSTASRLEIDNTPQEEVLRNAILLAEKILQPVRDQFGSYGPESWFRCEQLERAITKKGFANWSKNKRIVPDQTAWEEYFKRKSHPCGEAADIEITGIPNNELFTWIKNNLEYDQLIREYAVLGQPMSGWVHVSFRAENNRMQAFSIGSKK